MVPGRRPEPRAAPARAVAADASGAAQLMSAQPYNRGKTSGVHVPPAAHTKEKIR